jgi:hypothetical protein
MSRITFDEYYAAHLYELSLEHFQEGCIVCDNTRKRLEKFIGPKAVRHVKNIVKKHPYDTTT